MYHRCITVCYAINAESFRSLELHLTYELFSPLGCVGSNPSAMSIMVKIYGVHACHHSHEFRRMSFKFEARDPDLQNPAVSSASSPPLIEEDEIQILQVYSKEISKRMLDIVKSRNAVASVAQNDTTESETASSTVESTAATASKVAKAKEY
ncbi:hypothetical protein C1H46_035447 [Malus baccata]|uniref:WPP domain-containing protein n=1 Tax=Malus baccata TaxID=106549 RepID=A0A540KXL7_MALBA|nr:hypothetical protein C1H46_035447 [Malus baccata]